MDSLRYEHLKNKGCIAMTRDPDNPKTHVIVECQRYNEDGDPVTITHKLSLAEMQEVREKTHQECNRLDNLITDITAVLNTP